ncbi:acyl-CoA dehydrogenase family protein [Thermus thermophilus]|uniref:acyl-CoA dehydrogenase family protein n=1 Tax=Thermus thermophilus TaxID=274 RepID=UPI001FCBE3D8|nr:acyl-CoA dehydrogenase family protein [Thermus thermophilus]
MPLHQEEVVEWISYAYGKNHYEADPELRDLLRHFWPGAGDREAELLAWGAYMGREVYEAAYHIDQDAGPELVMHDLDGNRVDRVRLSPVQREVLKRLRPIVRPPYEGGSWHHHFALGYLLADGGLYCILTITHQVAYPIHKYAPGLASWKERVLYGEAFGATWMTEIQGGSDLGANRTVARREGEVWRLYGGDKYFASGAGLADVALVTARPEGAPPGPKGLALFLLPRLDREGRLNYRVRRLKRKSGTRAVPSGEVELEGSEAYLVGRAEEGIYYTLETLTVSRLANAIAAMGIAAKALLETRERVRRRQSFGRFLADHPLVRYDLLDLSVRQAGGLALALAAVEAFDRAWHERPPYGEAYHLARFLSHLAKNRTAEHSAEITRLAMELFGGLGFLEEYAVARWHRESLITPIWEGPSNIQALDLLEAMQKKGAHRPFLAWLEARLKGRGEEAEGALAAARKTLDRLAALEPEAAQFSAKTALRRLADAAAVAGLLEASATAGPRYRELAGLYARRFLLGEDYPPEALGARALYLPEGGA